VNDEVTDFHCIWT